MKRRITIAEIIEDFDAIEEWEERYTYLIELGRDLPSFPEHGRIESNRILGCQSRVWLLAPEAESDFSPTRPGFQFLADSDSLIVKGLIAVLMAIYLGREEQELLSIDEQEIFRTLGLDSHLSAGRRNGLSSLVLGIKRMAQHTVCQQARDEEENANKQTERAA